ncbi:hypothetical protein GLA29479_1321 [Lysobacter antibioticus]|nr:hypothetical protein GLA29479_1321 [Lysobacter antibioticus]
MKFCYRCESLRPATGSQRAAKRKCRGLSLAEADSLQP